jgi:hypothetical protein
VTAADDGDPGSALTLVLGAPAVTGLRRDMISGA